MKRKSVLIYSTQGFISREGRYRFLLDNFGKYIHEAKSLLDVGCDKNFLKKIIGPKVYGIDVSGEPDKVVDLETEALRAFPDNSFDTIICTEVLEHIDNLHEVIDEIYRVSSNRMIVSLPNSASHSRVWKILKTGKTGKFYGLPHQKPIDRHKWFFSAEEILNFVEFLASKHNLVIEAVVLRYNCKFPEETKLLSRIKQSVIAWFVSLCKITNLAQDVFFILKK